MGGSSGEFSSWEDEESETESESTHTTTDPFESDDNDETNGYFIFEDEEEINGFDEFSDELTATYLFGDNVDVFDDFEDFAVYDSVNDPKYQICVYQRIVVEIDFDFYQVDVNNECFSF